MVRFGPRRRGFLSISLSLSVDPHSLRNLLLFATGSNHFSGSRIRGFAQITGRRRQLVLGAGEKTRRSTKRVTRRLVFIWELEAKAVNRYRRTMVYCVVGSHKRRCLAISSYNGRNSCDAPAARHKRAFNCPSAPELGVRHRASYNSTAPAGGRTAVSDPLSCQSEMPKSIAGHFQPVTLGSQNTVPGPTPGPCCLLSSDYSFRR